LINSLKWEVLLLHDVIPLPVGYRPFFSILSVAFFNINVIK